MDVESAKVQQGKIENDYFIVQSAKVQLNLRNKLFLAEESEHLLHINT